VTTHVQHFRASHAVSGGCLREIMLRAFVLVYGDCVHHPLCRKEGEKRNTSRFAIISWPSSIACSTNTGESVYPPRLPRLQLSKDLETRQLQQTLESQPSGSMEEQMVKDNIEVSSQEQQQAPVTVAPLVEEPLAAQRRAGNHGFVQRRRATI
jgi:hypothetical protein